MKRLFISLLFAGAALSPVIAQPTAVQVTPDAIVQGKAVYDRVCTACHGLNAGAGERAPAIVASRSTSTRGGRTDAQFIAIVRNGIPGTGMPAWAGKLPDEDIVKLAAYIRTLRGTAIDNPLPGDVAHGQEVFWGKGGCGSCHTVSGRGAVLGPDLTDIATVRKPGAINDALTKVEHTVYGDGGTHLAVIPAMNYNPVQIVTGDGKVLDGLMMNQDAYSLQVMGMDSKLHLFDRAALRKVTIKPGSIMPSDYDKRLSAEEFKDLMAYLTRLGSKPVTAGKEVE